MQTATRTQCGTWAALVTLMAALHLPAGTAWAQVQLESAVKATYLYKFAPYVEWPADSLAGPGPFGICVIGTDPFGSVLDRAVVDQRAAGRAIVIVRLATARSDAGCQIAFVGGSAAQSVSEALRVLRGAPVLTVTQGGEAKGVIDFVIAQDRVRFVIDDQAAADNNLTISSKLLSLALSVKPRKRSGPGQ